MKLTVKDSHLNVLEFPDKIYLTDAGGNEICLLSIHGQLRIKLAGGRVFEIRPEELVEVDTRIGVVGLPEREADESGLA